MEERMRRHRRTQTSPERTKVWTERSPKHQRIREVPVVYYLSKNHHLEHPHFIEVPLSSPDGLYLRDVVNRLDDLRGKGMHLKFAWSSKRNYKTGYVWHDLSEDDLIVPVNGHEYILKGSELFKETDSGLVGPSGSSGTQDTARLLKTDSVKTLDDLSSSSSRNMKGDKAFQKDECCLSDQHPDSGGISSERILNGASGSGEVLSAVVGDKDGQKRNAADASTQTEESLFVPRDEDNASQSGTVGTLGSSKRDSREIWQNWIALETQNSDATIGCRLAPSSPYLCKSSSRRKNGVAEFLSKAEAKMTNVFKIHEEDSPRLSRPQITILEEDVQMSSSARLKVIDLFIQLISCGSIPVKGHSFKVSHSNRPRFANLNSPSPCYSTSSIIPEELNCSNGTRLMGMRSEDNEHLFGSMAERKTVDKGACLKNSSVSSGRSSLQLDPVELKNETNAKRTSPVAEYMRKSSDKSNAGLKTHCASNNVSGRITHSPSHMSSDHLHSSVKHGDAVTYEERLASGARVIIHSRASLDKTGEAVSSRYTSFHCICGV